MDKNSVVSWLRQAPPGTLVPAAEIAQLLADTETTEERPASPPLTSWRERLWTAPVEARIGRRELLEAVGKTANWLYRHSGGKAKCSPIPCRKLDGELVFVVGEIRQWLLEHEEMVEPGHSEPLVIPIKRRRTP